MSRVRDIDIGDLGCERAGNRPNLYGIGYRRGSITFFLWPAYGAGETVGAV